MEIHLIVFLKNLVTSTSIVYSKAVLLLATQCATRQKYKLVYLHHQWSDGAHTLQSCSTGEYFETPEYELWTPSGVWFTLSFRLICWHFRSSKSITSELCLPKFGRVANFRRIDLHHHELESLRIFFCDRVYVYTLCEKYTGTVLRTLEASKIKSFFLVTDFYGYPERATWTAWHLNLAPA